MNYQPVVEDGAKLLDQKRPGWANEINTERLEMNDCQRCILGQLYHYFSVGVHVLHIRPQVYGFDLPRTVSKWPFLRWPDLQSAWLVEIEKRRTP